MEATTNYAYRYTATLVDFTCRALIQTYTREPSEGRAFSNTSIVITQPSKWRQGKTITKEISYYRGREHSSEAQRTTKSSAPGMSSGASWSNGEFAQLLRIMFAPLSQAPFDWDHWEWRARKKLAVFSYLVGAAHSELVIDTQIARAGVWQNARGWLQPTVAFYVDPQSRAIFRLVANTVGIPSDYAMNRGNTTLDYGPVDIMGKTYFLLTSATSYIGTKQYESLFRKTFTRYGNLKPNQTP